MSDPNPILIVADWGTTNLRLYLIDDQLNRLAEIKNQQGLTNLTDSFPTTLKTHVNPWLSKYGELPIIVIGMAGSREGWVETPHIRCPAKISDLAGSSYKISLSDTLKALIVPGISANSISIAPDFMRGEETQVFGALELLKNSGHSGRCAFCLPGTHTKWVSVAEGSIESCSTVMTGEIFNLFCKHSILSTSISENYKPVDKKFIAGLTTSKRAGGLMHQVFSVRTNNILGSNSLEDGNSYLSGILIGNDILAMSQYTKEKIFIIGQEKLARLYYQAFNFFDMSSVNIDSKKATLVGAYNIAGIAGIINR